MNFLISIIKNRNTILVAAIVLGLIWGDIAQPIKHLTFYVLAIVLSFSTTGLVTSELNSKKVVAKAMGLGVVLNYFLFGLVILLSAYFLAPTQNIFYGFVVIAATPPGVAIIPFSYLLGGNINKSTLGTLGGFIASIFLAPFIIKIFTGNDNLEIFPIFISMLKIIVLPLLISRLLLIKPLKKITFAIRGQVVNWGFALIIFIAIGINRHVFLSNFDVLLYVGLIFFISMFVLGQVYDYVLTIFKVDPKDRLSQNLILTLKSSGFSVVTALELFNEEVVIPSAVMSIFVLSYLLFLTFKKYLSTQKS